MDYILIILEQLTGSELVAQRVFVLMSAVAFGVLVLALGFVASGFTDPLRRRLKQISGPDEGATATSDRDLTRFLEPLGGILVPKQEAERNANQERLIHAGYRSPGALSTFYAFKVVCTIVFPIVVLFSASMFPSLSSQRVMVLTIIGALAGLLAPSYFVSKRIDQRLAKLRRSFPDALDLLVVCVESGLGLGAAIQRVSAELDVSHPLLAAEFDIVNAEMRAGVERVEALKNLADRTGLPDIRGLVTLLAQSMRFGTSIAETLRVYAEEFRDKRMQTAEEAAAKIGTKLIFPLTFCLFPAFFIIAIGPAILKIMDALGKI